MGALQRIRDWRPGKSALARWHVRPCRLAQAAPPALRTPQGGASVRCCALASCFWAGTVVP
eukprot:11965857-Alexandrium_andersonii.AAC.1